MTPLPRPGPWAGEGSGHLGAASPVLAPQRAISQQLPANRPFHIRWVQDVQVSLSFVPPVQQLCLYLAVATSPSNWALSMAIGLWAPLFLGLGTRGDGGLPGLVQKRSGAPSIPAELTRAQRRAVTIPEPHSWGIRAEPGSAPSPWLCPLPVPPGAMASPSSGVLSVEFQGNPWPCVTSNQRVSLAAKKTHPPCATSFSFNS